MTHPTIEAAQKAITEAYEPGAYNSKSEAYAAARVILSAPPSEAEVEAVRKFLASQSVHLGEGTTALLINAFLAQRRKELGGSDGVLL